MILELKLNFKDGLVAPLKEFAGIVPALSQYYSVSSLLIT